MKSIVRTLLLVLAVVAAVASAQVPQLPDFTYQGHLEQNGHPPVACLIWNSRCTTRPPAVSRWVRPFRSHSFR